MSAIRLPEPARPTPASRSAIEVTLLIVTWNGRHHLERHVASVLEAAQRSRYACEVLVVDNGSTDGTRAWLRERYPEIRLLALECNKGFGGGNNRGAQAACGKWLVFLNNDVRVEPNFLDPLLKHFESPDVFAVGARLEALEGFRCETGLTRGMFRYGLFTMEHNRDTYDIAVSSLYPSGSAMAVDREKFLTLGGFDELFAPFYWEDTDLGYRAWKRGWRVLFEPRSIAYHTHRGTIRNYPTRFINLICERNRWLFTWKDLIDQTLWLKHFVWLPVRLMKALVTGQWGTLVAFGWACGRLPQVQRARVKEQMWIRRSDAQVLRLACDPLTHQAAFPPSSVPPRAGRMKLLWVCPYLPREGVHGGGGRMFALIRELAKRHEVWVISFATPQEQQAAAPLREACHHVDVVPRLTPWKDDPFSRVPAFVHEFAHPNMAGLVRRRLLEEAFDIAQFEYLLMAQYAPRTYVGATLLTEHQVHGFARWRDFQSPLFSWPHKAHILGSTLKGIVYELSICKRFDGVTTLTAEDARLLRPSLPDIPIAVLPTGVDCETFRRNGIAPLSSDLLYVGYFSHLPNVDAVLWFAQAMWPKIRQVRPQTTWTIVGAEPPEAIQALAREPGIRVTGWVADLRPYLAGASIFIMPIRIGGGIRGKLMEAWAMGCAVVSTSLGCHGSLARPGVHVLLADEPRTFSAAVLRLLADETARRALGEAGRRHVEERFDWRLVAQGHEAFYETVLQRKTRSHGRPDTVVEAVGAHRHDPHA